MNSSRSRFRRFPVLVFAVFLFAPPVGVGPSNPAAGEAFHFKRFCTLAAGDRFRIVALGGHGAGSDIGEGRILKRTARELALTFTIDTAVSGTIQGDLELKHLGARDRYKERFRLRYSGRTSAGTEAATEEILADAFLVQNGILTLHASGGRRFFQLSLDSRGHNKFITHWGASRLELRR